MKRRDLHDQHVIPNKVDDFFKVISTKSSDHDEEMKDDSKTEGEKLLSQESVSHNEEDLDFIEKEDADQYS